MRFAALGCFLALSVIELGRAADLPDYTLPADKNSYHLLNPTPVSLLRELATDRPDKTESPYTVDAGHFQLEMDLQLHSRRQAGPFCHRAG